MIGAGGHAKTVINALKSMDGFEIRGIVDPQRRAGEEVAGCQVLGDDSILDKEEMRTAALSIGVGITRASDLRKKIYDKFKALGYEFAIVRDPNAIIACDVVISEGVQIMAGVIIQPGSRIGKNSIINTSVIVEHDCNIGDHSHLAPGSIIGGDVVIGDCSMIGLGARVLPGVKIGKGVTVGAGAVVVKDVEDGQTVVGVPAA
jgi:UDP-perosamine 4-acetyltransferase